MSYEKGVVLAMMIVNGLGLFLVERVTHPGPMTPERRRHVPPNLSLSALLVALNFLLDRIPTSASLATHGQIGLLGRASLPTWLNVIIAVVAFDGVTYVAHVLMHKLPSAWRFHRVHHSDPHVDVTTAFRQHPLETLWRYALLCAAAFALGASTWAVAVYLAVSALNAQLEHADIALPSRLDQVLRLTFSTPAMHQVHHSRALADTDTNYSNIFSFWDRLFGTYRAPRLGERIACGLDDHDAPDQQRTVGLLALPFARNAIVLVRGMRQDNGPRAHL